MYAQCPECDTFFRVRATQLRAAGGQVRCSRCDTLFNALLTLHEELPAATPEPETLRPQNTGRDPNTPGDLFAEQSLRENEALALDEVGPDAAPATTKPVPGDVPPAQLLKAPREHWGWALGSVLLVLLLLGQAVHAQREVLARHAWVGPWIGKLYAALDMPLQPPRDIAKLRVLESEITSHPSLPGVLRLNAMLANEADFAQPLPMLRVKLENRWGEVVGVRFFLPEEYITGAVPDDGLFAAGATQLASLEIVDPGNAAVGFVLETCFKRPGSSRCSSDVKEKGTK